MCNTCNTGFNGRSSNGCGCCCVGASLLSALFGCGNCYNSCGSNWGSQRVCRDSCGNLRIQQRSSNSCCSNGTWNSSNCGCYSSGTWNNSSYGCCSNGISSSVVSNGSSCCHSCACGSNTAETFPISGDGYYARQYGLTNRSGNSCCSLLSSYNV